MSVKVTRDKTAEVIRAISQLAKKDVLVGIPEDTSARAGEPITNAQLGYIHEFGAPAANIPARPFLVPGVHDAQVLIAKQFGAGAKAALSGNAAAAETALKSAGMLGRNAVVRKISTGPFAPNAPSTIAAKGSDRPLINTGDLRKAITFVVRDK